MDDWKAERVAGFAADLRHLAEMVETDPDLYDLLWTMRDGPNAPIPGDDSAVAELAAIARLGLQHNCKVDKEFDDWASVNVTLPAGVIRLHFYAERERVCTRRVVATREVVKEVPDPSAPKVTVTEVEEVVEWDCHPLLAAVSS